jgi:hypothetical protein
LVLQPVAPTNESVKVVSFIESNRLKRVTEYITTEFKAHLDSCLEFYRQRKKHYIKFALEALDPELPDDEGLVPPHEASGIQNVETEACSPSNSHLWDTDNGCQHGSRFFDRQAKGHFRNNCARATHR